MTQRQRPARSEQLPRWVPDAAKHYLEHTEDGRSIRALARASDCHPSTVLRQVRRFEGRRDDPLVDSALKSLSHPAQSSATDMAMSNPETLKQVARPVAGLTQDRIEQEARRILRRLCEQGAVLAVARDLDSAVVVRESAEGEQMRTAVVDREIAQAMALKEWIGCNDAAGRVARYFITHTGRTALRRLMAEDENRAGGFVDRRTEKESDWDLGAMDSIPRQPSRYHVTESPLIGLARRKDRDGRPFLKRELVTAAERLREDFELAQVGHTPIVDWESLMGEGMSAKSADAPQAASAARARVHRALSDLGPGLCDVVMRCCCLLEGLEQTEKKMGWSARSGKIVLRIALQRLQRHYDEQGRFAPMIG